MYIVTVQLSVKEDRIEEFVRLTLENATNARREPGCLRFDVLRHEAEATKFFFYEVYKSQADLKAHQETEHYKKWRDNVPDLLAETRIGTRYTNVSPTDAEWQ